MNTESHRGVRTLTNPEAGFELSTAEFQRFLRAANDGESLFGAHGRRRPLARGLLALGLIVLIGLILIVATRSNLDDTADAFATARPVGAPSYRCEICQALVGAPRRLPDDLESCCNPHP